MRRPQRSSPPTAGFWPATRPGAAPSPRPAGCRAGGPRHRYVVFTGGEPLLQLDEALIAAVHAQGFEIAVETNGTLAAPPGIDWICVSPKAGTPIVQIAYLTVHDGTAYSVILSTQQDKADEAMQAYDDLLGSWTWES